SCVTKWPSVRLSPHFEFSPAKHDVRFFWFDTKSECIECSTAKILRGDDLRTRVATALSSHFVSAFIRGLAELQVSNTYKQLRNSELSKPESHARERNQTYM